MFLQENGRAVLEESHDERPDHISKNRVFGTTMEFDTHLGLVYRIYIEDDQNWYEVNDFTLYQIKELMDVIRKAVPKQHLRKEYR